MPATDELPDRPSLENLRKRAKQLHKQIVGGDSEAVDRAREHLPRLGGNSEADATSVTLQEVQHIVAVEYGYASWKDLLADLNDPRLARRPTRKIPIRPGLPNLEREADMLLRSAQEGRPWCVPRLKSRVPRLAELPDEDLSGAGVTLEEARQIIATDYGYAGWSDLADELGQLRPVQCFEDLADLADDEIREVIVRLGRDRLSVVFKTVSDHFKDRFAANMSDGEWQALAEAMEELGPMPVTQVEAESRR